jgi:hypothetical protein
LTGKLSWIKMSFGMEGRPVVRLVRAQYNTWSFKKKGSAVPVYRHHGYRAVLQT